MTASAAIGLWAAVTGAVDLAASWGRNLPWVIAASHAIKVYYEAKAVNSSPSVIDAAASTVFLLSLEVIRCSKEPEYSDNSWLLFVKILPSLLLLVVFLSIPRGNGDLQGGLSVDRQNTAPLIEVLMFLWPRKVFKLDTLRREDVGALPVLSTSLRTEKLTESHRRFARGLDSHKLGVVLLWEYLGPLALQWLLAILNALALLGPKLVTYRLLQQLSGEREAGNRDSLFLALLLGGSKFLPVLLGAWIRWIGTSMIDIPMQNALSALTYQKILSLPAIPVSAEDKQAQRKETWLQMDGLSLRACYWFSTCHVVVGLSTQLITKTAVLIALVGWKSVAVAIAAVLLIAPVTASMVERWTALLIKNWKFGRERSAVLHKALLAIRQIKLSAAEPSWKQKIYDIRDKEVQGYNDIAWLRFWMVMVENIGPDILSGVPIYVYAWQGHALTASVAFTFINLFKELQSNLVAIPGQFSPIRTGWATAGELDAFLRKEEIIEPQLVSCNALSLRDATVTWHSKVSEKATFHLQNLEAEFPTGELSIITGKTGCGKSLLLSALAGEAKILSGNICRPQSFKSEHSEENLALDWVKPGTFAFVSQTPWMDNATIRDNVLFGLPMVEERYACALYCCALDKDLLRFEDGDMTVISIKGVSISGGQRSRIALARALYSQASFLLMDDVLSAVDVEVREWIVEKALCGSLARGRTRVLVTHHEEQLRSKISCRLLIRDQTATCELVSNGTSSSTEQASRVSSPPNDGFDYSLYCRQNLHPSEKETTLPVQPTRPDTAGESFHMAPYVMYFNASGGRESWLLVLTSLLVCEWSRMSAFSWLEEWVSGSEASLGPSRPNSLPPGQAYMLMSALTTVTVSLRGFIMFKLYRTASRKLFHQITEHIFGAPLQWVESASHGEILQRCDRDMRNLDEDLTYAIGPLFALISQLITFMWTSTSLSFYSTPLMIGLFYLVFNFGRNLIPATKYLTAIESTASSVFLQHCSSLYAPDGVSTLRAYEMKDHFIQRANRLLDRRASAIWYQSLHSVVTDFQIGSLGAAYVALACYFIAVSGAGAGTVGTTLSFAVQLSETLSSCLGHISAMDSGLMSAERLVQYGSIEQEPSDGSDVGDSWPEEGQVQVYDYKAGYGPGLPDTLRDVTFTIKTGERVGVVGRTGAGKSTLALSFARLIEKRGGTIRVDSVDILRIKLQVLRKRILIIPQDPYLFGGTLRAIIDPDNAHSDEELAACLQRFRFFPTTANVATKSGARALGLSFMVSDGGANLSQGQRQILCLIQATLSRKKVVIMDEATSAVDMETDSAIQAVIREGLLDTTVMVIAHRLATVAHLDKVLVMHNGKVVEFGKPAELYQQKGQFRALVNRSIDKEELVKAFTIQ
ncbi:ABC transporter, transmembrane domain, type 1 [Beauveria brongniartii RCEF 3172]|uniref:ABC transporter, transmembrane domain, type 1 n=1 Tax=Beauveria brongniartii RCEF 3172 TaxID=1081107 RepID=A0A166YX06_9HYPO|nr:ABC transporter, transmembrane domain, type 1 [Beauveria brongniartii RCEF 3172]